MTKITTKALIFVLLLMFSSCSVIGGIFKIGVEVGIFLVLVLIVVILYLVNRFRKRK